MNRKFPVTNKNNYLRIGKHNGTYRVAAWPARHYHNNNIGRGSGITRHIHIERGKILYQNHKKNAQPTRLPFGPMMKRPDEKDEKA